MPSVLIVLPVYNEENVLFEKVRELTAFLREHDQYEWKVIIADNNSDDMTGSIASDLASQDPLVQHLHVHQKGLGIALRTAWEQADCDYVTYMDIDLSTSLEALIRAIDLLEAGADIVTANRFDKNSNIKRCLKREIVSRCYNMILRTTLRIRIHDAHCGFKGARREIAQDLLNYIEDNGFFFAAEFLFYGKKLGYKIVEFPVTWTEDLNSKANIVKDAYDDFRGIYRLLINN
ncbi:MAG: glycosyltransferase [Nitrospira sp.]|nr:glycosyltransferase [Nitrospira sp.]